VGDAWSAVYCVVGFNYWMPKAGAAPDSDKPYGVFAWQNMKGLRWTQNDWSQNLAVKVRFGSKTVKVPLATFEAVELAFGPPIVVSDGITQDMLKVYAEVWKIAEPILRAGFK
jgi:hypothetical protein